MKNFKNFVFVTLLLVASTVLGQTTLKGVIVDETNTPLLGASVLEKGTTNGVEADFDGNFTLKTKSNSGVLIISY